MMMCPLQIEKALLNLISERSSRWVETQSKTSKATDTFFWDCRLQGSKIDVIFEKTLDKSDAEPKILAENLQEANKKVFIGVVLLVLFPPNEETKSAKF